MLLPEPRIYVFRHGETDWSRAGKHTGKTDLPLTPHGEQQARDLAPIVAGLSFTHVLVSPRERARRTCALAGLGEVAITEPLLQEWDYGKFEGLTSHEIHARQPHWNLFRDGCPGGESPADVQSRCERLIEKISALSGHVALFSHGHFLRSLGAAWAGWTLESAGQLYLSTGHFSVLGCERADQTRRVLLAWNARDVGTI